MSAILTFMVDHFVVAFFVGLPALCIVAWALVTSLAVIVSLPFKLVNRFIRHLNIRKHGWPPAHLDADGDSISAED